MLCTHCRKLNKVFPIHKEQERQRDLEARVFSIFCPKGFKILEDPQHQELQNKGSGIYKAAQDSPKLC